MNESEKMQETAHITALQQERDRLLRMAAINDALPTLIHEIKNPLAAVTAAIEVMLEDSRDESLQGSLHAILRQLRRIRLTIDSVNLGNRELWSTRHAAVDLALREALSILGAMAQAHGIPLHSYVEDMPLLPIDPAVVRAILYNLVTNSVDACKSGGEIRVRGVLRGNRDVFELTVQDSGCGMSPEVLGRCTELFFSTKAMGSGIGLALCHRVLDGAGGSLQIESEPGKGTRVVASVKVNPRAERSPTSRPPPPSPSPSTAAGPSPDRPAEARPGHPDREES